MKPGVCACILLLVTVLIIQACGDSRKAKNYNEKTLVDEQGLAFINKADESILTQVKASVIAQQISKNSRVIEFAAMLIADRTQTGIELAEIAKKQMVTATDTISNAHQKTIDSLSKLKGRAFDKGYIALMVDDHTQAVKFFEEASSNKNSNLNSFARKTLPAIKVNKDTANAIAASLR